MTRHDKSRHRCRENQGCLNEPWPFLTWEFALDHVDDAVIPDDVMIGSGTMWNGLLTQPDKQIQNTGWALRKTRSSPHTHTTSTREHVR